MKALMFGWEFPPHILGGLGTASYGLTKGMAMQDDLEITFVIPKPHGDEDQSFLKIVGACNVPIVWKENNWDYVNKETFIYDIIYVPQMTKFLQMAQQNGNPVLNGEGMLVEQGAAAFKIWTGCEADVEVMTKELRAYLRNL